MQFKNLTLAAIVGIASAQNLTSVLSSTPELSNLTALLTTVTPNLATSLLAASNITILAPSNDAITAFLSSNDGLANANNTDFISALLQYHVLQGTILASAITATPSFPQTLLNDTATGIVNVTGAQVVEAVTVGQDVVFYSGDLQNSTVTTANVNFTGGIVHIVDRVLTLPGPLSISAAAVGLTSLAGALAQAQLVETLESTRDITVFAPTNEAFDAIGSAVGNLSITQLQSILGYHVLNGTVAYSSLLQSGTIASLAGPDLTITLENGTVFVNSARVITPNVLVSNGVVHVIDQVLNPNATTATPVPSAVSQTVAFSGATSGTAVPFTSGVPTPATPVLPTGTTAAAAPSGSGGAASGTASGGSTAGAFAPMRTGAVGMAALFAGAGVVMNF